MIAGLPDDIRYALRKLRRAPLFAAAAVGTLGVGIAAITTIFSFVNAAWFRPLPYPDADRIHAISEGQSIRWNYSSVGPETAEELLRGSAAFERLAFHRTDFRRIVDEGGVQPVTVLAVDTSFQAMLQLRPQIGRFLSPDEIFGDASAAAISDTLWRSRFGGDPAIMGKSVAVGEQRYAIVGVMPRGFRYPERTDVWIPLARRVPARDAEDITISVIGKLSPGVTREAAQAELDVIAARLRAAGGRDAARLRLNLRDEMLDRNANSFMPMPSFFLGAAFLVLLVACTNIGNLFLARAAERRSEMAVRGSLGASRLRLARQVITEGMVVAVVAAAAGTLLSVWLVKLCLALLPTQGFPSWLDFGLDARVLGFSVAITFVVTLLVGMAPAREGTRFDLARALKAGGDGGAGRSGVQRGARRGLVVQLALALVLVVASGLLVRSYREIARVDLGYPAEQVASVEISYDQARYPQPEDKMRFVENLLPRLEGLPGARVVTAGGNYVEPRSEPVAQSARIVPSQRRDWRLFVNGDTTTVGVRGAEGSRLVTADGYFEALGIRLLRGRAFERNDAIGSAPVVVVSRRFAELAFDDGHAVGRTVQIGATGQPYTIVGVVEDVRSLRAGSRGFSAARGADVYFTSRQARGGNYEILARAENGSAAKGLHELIAGIVRNEDPSLIIFRDQTLASGVDEHLFVTRVLGVLLGAFAATALFLAVIGVYAMVAYGVSQRTREIGVRMALGGTGATIVRMVVAEGLRFVAIGLAVGLLLAAATTRLMRILVFGVSPLDAVTYAVALLLLGGIALLACWVPALRASRVDPLVALRAE